MSFLLALALQTSHEHVAESKDLHILHHQHARS